MLKHLLRVALLFLVIAIGIGVYLGWPDTARVDIAQVQGTRPLITEPRRQVIPTVKVADVVGWQGGAMPTPAAGLTVQPFARGLDEEDS